MSGTATCRPSRRFERATAKRVPPSLFNSLPGWLRPGPGRRIQGVAQSPVSNPKVQPPVRKAARSNWCRPYSHRQPCLSTTAQGTAPGVSVLAYNSPSLPWRIAWRKPGLTRTASRFCPGCCLRSKPNKPIRPDPSIPKPRGTRRRDERNAHAFLWKPSQRLTWRAG